MTAFFVAVIALAVLAIALISVRWAEVLLARRDATALFEIDEAIEFVATALPDEVSAEIGYDDVEAVIATHLAMVEADPVGGGAIISDEVVDAVAERLPAGNQLARDRVAAVLAAELDYLDAIGAVGESANE